MNTQNPATPPKGATPGSEPQNDNQKPPVTNPPSTPGAGGNEVGKVTMTTDEFNQLKRDAARGKSQQKREEIHSRKNPPAEAGDPDAQKLIEDANRRADDAQKKLLQVEVKDSVRSLLDTDEFKTISKATKAVILENPALLSNADNLEEALLDIGDYLRDKVVPLELNLPDNRDKNTPGSNPPGHDTPPAPGAGAPANAEAAGLEDLTKLTGPARSQAAIRNAMKSAKGTKKV